jgi:hypothetical protein
VVKIFGPREEAITLFNRKVYNKELHKAYISAVLSKRKVHPRTGREGPEGGKVMALLFLQPWR